VYNVSASNPFASTEFRNTLEKERERLRNERWSGLTEEARLWLALAPAWTLPLAEAVGFPADNLEALLHDLEKRRLLEVYLPNPTEHSAAVYSLKGSLRDEVLANYLAEAKDRQQLRSTAQKIGRLICPHMRELPTPPRTARWAVLAATATRPDKAANMFDRKVEAALKREPDEVFNWIEAARPLADLLTRDQAPALELALQRAGRRLELFHRRQRDAQYLITYLTRPAQDQAFLDLLQLDAPAWALHYLGSGGTGKTMLLRHIQVNLAEDQNTNTRRAITARIDFDYLNPDYPDRTPGLLLWAFAEELRSYDKSGEADRRFHKVDRRLRKLHDRLQANVSSGPPRRATAAPEFVSAVGEFIEALEILSSRPGGPPHPIVLILDTCEELARHRATGEPRNLTETMRILRALHDGPGVLADPPGPRGGGLPLLRVIFAGRLPLAQAGANYNAASTDLEPQTFLYLHELEGFTQTEAETYLRERVKVPEGYVDAILKHGRGRGSVAQITSRGAHAAAPPRWHPYDLKDFSDWVHSEPHPTPEDVESANEDRFVKLRILQRMSEGPVKQALPVLALLGHFDLHLLAVTCGLIGPEDPEAALTEDRRRQLREELQPLDWVERRDMPIRDGLDKRVVWKIESRLRARLRSHYRAEANLAPGRQWAANYLEGLTLSGDLGAFDWTAFDAAVGALEPEPDRAVAWWSELSKRLLIERGPAWTARILEFVTGPEGAAALPDPDKAPRGAPESWMRPLILDTHLTCLRRSGQQASLAQSWCEEVIAKAGAVPEPAGTNLRLRGLADRVALARLGGPQLTKDVLDPLWNAAHAIEPGALEVTTAAVLLDAFSALFDDIASRPRDDRSSIRRMLGVSDDRPEVEPEQFGPWRLVELVKQAAVAWNKEARITEPKEAVNELIAVFD
jgi:hypothetical protein